MPRRQVLMRKETRMLGAVQIMIGLAYYGLGVIWAYLLLSQLMAFQNGYLPIAVATAYPFWSAIFFIISGTFAVILEKTRSRGLVTYTLVMSIFSACISVIGMLLLILEFLIFSAISQPPIWPQICGKILSDYLFIFSLMELVVSSVVTHWAYKARFRR